MQKYLKPISWVLELIKEMCESLIIFYSWLRANTRPNGVCHSLTKYRVCCKQWDNKTLYMLDRTCWDWWSRANRNSDLVKEVAGHNMGVSLLKKSDSHWWRLWSIGNPLNCWHNCSKGSRQLEGASLRHTTFPSLSQVLKNPTASSNGNQRFPPRGAKGELGGDKSPVTFNLSYILTVINVSGDAQLDKPRCAAGIYGTSLNCVLLWFSLRRPKDF